MTTASPHDQRLLELLADRALDGLTAEETRELDGCLAAEGVDDDLSMDLTAAAVALAFVEPAVEPLPAHLRARLLSTARSFAATTQQAPELTVSRARTGQPETARSPADSGRPGLAITDSRPSRGSGIRVLPWIAAAAGIGLAAIAWWPAATGPVDPASRMASLEREPGTLELAWQDWDNPEIAGVKGQVVWSDAEQEGYMRFVGLPANDPSREQYQLWIIDRRGMQKRVSGGVFNVPSSGEVVVPIDPGVQVKDAAAFAVTIEEPGGTPVSDMDRRVVIAAKG